MLGRNVHMANYNIITFCFAIFNNFRIRGLKCLFSAEACIIGVFGDIYSPPFFESFIHGIIKNLTNHALRMFSNAVFDLQIIVYKFKSIINLVWFNY